MNAQIVKVSEQVYKCNHVTDDGLDAYMPIGIYGEGYEQCVLCGDVKCTEPQDEPEMFRENVPAF